MAKTKKSIVKKSVKESIDDEDKKVKGKDVEDEEDDAEGGPFKKYKNLAKK